MNLIDSIIYLCLGILAIPILIVGLVMIVSGIITFYITAFRVSLFWCVLCLVFPLAIAFFAFRYWKKAQKPIFTVLGGVLLISLAATLFEGGR